MEYNIIQMSVAASYDGTDPSGPIFNDSAAQIRLNLSNSLSYVEFKDIGRMQPVYVPALTSAKSAWKQSLTMIPTAQKGVIKWRYVS